MEGGDNMEHEHALPDDLHRCVEFHGHIRPGLIYGYRVAKEALRLMGTGRAMDEKVVAVCENDSCAVNALQTRLGTAAGKGNLIIRDYRKNAYTIISRTRRRACRFSRYGLYAYDSPDKDEFNRLEASLAPGTASHQAS